MTLRPIVPDCRACGLCCTADRPEVYCGLEPHELAALPPSFRDACVRVLDAGDDLASAVDGRRPYAIIQTRERPVRSGPLAGTSLWQCAALSGEPAEAVECTIYETRPHACREVVNAGDASCQAMRRARGLAT